jgi:hypothetical protein
MSTGLDAQLSSQLAAAVGVTNFTQLNTALVDQTVAEMTELMAESNPQASLIRGTIKDLLIYFSALFAASNQTNNQLQLAARSLLDIANNPTLANTALVNGILSNFRVALQPGTLSAGVITIIVSQNAPVVIPNGSLFLANGVAFSTTSVFLARVVGSVVTTTTDRVLTPLADGTFAFSIPVTATTAGPVGNLPLGTQLIPEALPINFVTCYAESDFSGGVAPELTSTVLGQLASGIAIKAISNRTTTKALLLNQPQFSSIVTLSEIGFGDVEMSRDRHSIFPVSYGGRTDLYLRSQALPQSLTLTKTAILVGLSAQGGIWQFSVARDEAPGFYFANRIVLPTAGQSQTGYTVTSDVRGVDLSTTENDGVTYTPDILTAQEGTFSRYQTAVIQFLDTDTPTTNLVVGTSQQAYLVSLLTMPLVDKVQDFIGQRSVVNPVGDILVKACVPCLLSLSFTVRLPLGAAMPNTAQIASDLATRVNQLPFLGQLYSSLLAETIQLRLTGNAAVAQVQMFGKIYPPDLGLPIVIRSDDVLAVPSFPNRGVTGRTVGFILDPRNISISTTAAGFAEV